MFWLFLISLLGIKRIEVNNISREPSRRAEKEAREREKERFYSTSISSIIPKTRRSSCYKKRKLKRKQERGRKRNLIRQALSIILKTRRSGCY